MVGVFSGTFDPVHEGHVAFCLAAIEQVGLERVILLPERQPRGKKHVSDFAHRAAMLKIATQDHPQLEVTELEDEQFTAERTLPELRRRFGSGLALLIGSDIAKTLDAARWPGLDRLLTAMQLVVAVRHTDDKEKIESHLRQLGQAHFLCISSPRLHAASTAVRQGGRVTHLDANVRQYIAANNLYPQVAG